ncbi:TetR/AcrR family transcriptional regulator [Natronoglycomyces albus]|uniref:TetR/AcrR family transcriptional regulator n=1 Tax=Natronoglycomyces albus TaxID=2811108 RepID=A0A895XIW3_9ACTN|nr:TetR/AcrR family transcriptional regulator [Natronoglycomyces albus]QSB04897.1 TetR/AcrR family transcriptional regulator [Natronoglycomyces albus]
MATRSDQRKQRLRQATMDEIRTTARRLLVERGANAVTINAVARDMGLSGPALYHYYAGHEELVEALVAQFYGELTSALIQARDQRASETPVARLLEVCRAMRTWVVAHPAEFNWIFTKPVPSTLDDSERERAGARFEGVFLDLFVQIWREAPFPVPELEGLDASVREQLAVYVAERGDCLPVAAAHVFLTCWTRLYGLLCMEALGQLDFAFTDVEPVFEQTLREIVEGLNGEYAPPR